MGSRKVNISFGAMSRPIADQLKEQGLSLRPESCRHYQRDADAIVRLAIRGYLSAAPCRKMRQRIIDEIAGHPNLKERV